VRRRNARTRSDNTVPVAAPPLPRTLKGEARAEWQRVVPVLLRAGVLSTVDRAVLIRYCTVWADWVELDGLLQASGKLVQGQRGNLVRSPLWIMRQGAADTVLELARQLLLTPNARLRAGITLEPKPTEITDPKISAFERYSRSQASE
jgi:P27 family predicted phage terminase small subunit